MPSLTRVRYSAVWRPLNGSCTTGFDGAPVVATSKVSSPGGAVGKGLRSTTVQGERSGVALPGRTAMNMPIGRLSEVPPRRALDDLDLIGPDLEKKRSSNVLT